ncbi:hypothetical protein [Actinomycetospora sp. CA-053990]|uniref:hypothetical protein n=1 Tax=Actinomycetospora sp. CA-053990 TaxID=3239891 RepID=UPI003D8ACD6F
MAVLPVFDDDDILPAWQLNALRNEIERVVIATFSDNTRTNKPLFKVRRTSNQSITQNTDTLVVWQTYSEDPDGMWDPAVPNRVTSKRAGVWLLMAQERYPLSASGDRAGKIMWNGTSVFDNSIASYKGAARNDGEGTTLSLGCIKRLGVGDAIYLNTWQSSSTAQNLTSGAAEDDDFGGTWLSGVWLGP